MQWDVAQLDRLFRADPELAITSRHWSARVAIEVGADAYLLTLRDGEVQGFERARTEQPELRLAGSEQQWREQLEAVPRPYWQDPLMGAMFAEGAADPANRFRVEGDNFAHVFPFYPAIQRIVAILREYCNGGVAGASTLAPVQRAFDRAVGRYAYVMVQGVQYRVYFEEAGAGIPVLCQHTAGSDSRQYRHLLEDEELGLRYRFIAYDLPYHGRSNPPNGIEWWKQDYKLRLDFLLEFVVAFSRALAVERPIFMGCSVGGFLAPDLAYYRPAEFRGVVGMNSAVHFGHVEISDMTRSYSHPKLSGAWKAANMLGLMAPGTPEALRREIAWFYSQGAPAVFEGDLQYYLRDHDLRGKLQDIDTRKCPVYILVGEYDRLRVAPMGSKAVAEGIPGAHYAEVAQGGHFLMSENPVEFRRIIGPILDAIAAHPGA